MSVSVVVETLFLACIYILYPMFYMYHVTVRNKVVLYIVLYNCSYLSFGFRKQEFGYDCTSSWASPSFIKYGELMLFGINSLIVWGSLKTL